MTERPSLVGAILAGGAGRRLGGIAKPRLVIGGRPIVERALDALRGVADEVMLVTPDPAAFADLGIATVADLVPDRAGPLQALLAALDEAHRRGATRLLAMAGDLPFVGVPLLAHLVALAPGAPAVVPCVDGQDQPLLAVYATTSREAARACLRAGRRDLRALLAAIDVLRVPGEALATVDPDLRSFFNVNTPADLARAQAWAAAAPRA